jgi:tetratricopeptide (TPR) repeat protein
MSILDSFTKKKTLTTAINQTAKARSAEGKTADALYKVAYQDYAEVLVGDSLRADALYHWGFALLHQAKAKTDIEAFKLLEESIAKFSFCLLLNPSYLGAAINGGVAYMDLARLIAVESDDELYENAKIYFEKANAIQAGSASYNLACIFGLRNEEEACLQALENAKYKGNLPDAEEIINDPDLEPVKNQPWFVAFMEKLTEKAEAVTTETVEAVTENTTEPEPAPESTD